MMRYTLMSVLVGGLLWSLTVQAEGYDPLAVQEAGAVTQIDLVVNDPDRSREIPLRVYLPSEREPAGVVLFSHGLGGSRENNPYLGKHWAGRGYVAVFMQHHGSDESVWKDTEPLKRMRAMKQAASLENRTLRIEDVPVVIDQLERWNADDDSPLSARLDMDRLGMSGHSFGAVTTQAVSGQRSMWGRANAADERIKAAVIMSPSTPRLGKAERSFDSVSIPWLLMTGTLDLSPIGGADMASRLGVYPALPDGNKYEIVLHNGEHGAFGDRKLPGEKLPRNPNHHRVILALSTAFWDAYLNDDNAALAWLQGEGPADVMEQADRWQMK